MRLLFVKTALVWPRSSGHDVFTYYTMKACAELGHEVFIATTTELKREAIDGFPLAGQFRLDIEAPSGDTLPPATWLQTKFRSFWGINPDYLKALRRVVAETRADVVVVVGLNALPYFPPLEGVVRVWFAADEWVWHHLSMVKLFDPRSWANLKDAAIKGLYERAHAHAVDRVWVVFRGEQRAMRVFAGMPRADVVPLGVDGIYFQPAALLPGSATAAFWGRLDFGPNIQGLEWFCRQVWPLVRAATPDARFTIIGFKPTDEVRALAQLPGITLVPDVPDLRDEVRRHAIAIMPFVSGGGIKNKLLEAAALGMPIVCTPIATQGLHALDEAPFAVHEQPAEMAAAIQGIWADPARRQAMGAGARAWVTRHHTWKAAAESAVAPIARLAGGAA